MRLHPLNALCSERHHTPRLTSLYLFGDQIVQPSRVTMIAVEKEKVSHRLTLAFGRLAVISSCRRQRIHPLKESREALFVGATAFSIRRFDKAILDLLSLRTEWVHQG